MIRDFTRVRSRVFEHFFAIMMLENPPKMTINGPSKTFGDARVCLFVLFCLG